MSKPKHTEGPWTPALYETTPTMLERLQAQKQWSVATNHNPNEPQGMLVALCGDADDVQSLADAHLIAAAPMMLKALEKLMEGYIHESGGYDDLTDMAQEAINLAKGKTKGPIYEFS